MEKLIKQAKKFVATKSKSARPVLTAIAVDREFIIATDSHKLIRIRHGEEVSQPYLHHLKTVSEDCKYENYPDVRDFVPGESSAAQVLEIDLVEWRTAHAEALVAAKHRDDLVCWLTENGTLRVSPQKFCEVKDTEKCANVPEEQQMPFIYNFVSGAPNFEIAYNCKFMCKTLQVFSILKEKPKLYYYGELRPLMLKSENIEVLIVPIRIERGY